MSSKDKDLEDVLYAFSVEPKHDEETLSRYLEKYPKYAEDLLDVLHELQFTEALACVETAPVADPSAQEAWNQFVRCKPASEEASAAETFGEKLRGQAFINLATAMNVPRAFLVAFRDRLVTPASIPKQFIASLAKAGETETRTVLEYLSLPPQLAIAAEFKSDEKPELQGQMTFKELVDTTEMPDENRQALLKDCGTDGP
ncbi:hypothetical protein [uncultured Gimesia sp.]|uniref:hypothetical protein n=1 Tax=uncultured Gimesia sp. TaxID=1678688 RepID=UPI0030D94E30|tara:strand:+ start:8983 stop:9585 length:603 start_codon:yes stop_codon:yes gene_type:complete